MNKIKVYGLEIILLALLSYTLIFPSFLNSRTKIAVLLAFFAILISCSLKQKRTLSIKKKDVFKLIILLGFIYIALLYTLGIYAGFYKATVKFSIKTLVNYIIPITVMIISSEYIRDVFINYDSKLIKIINFLIQIIIDLFIYTDNIYKFNTLDETMVLIGYVLFASIASNLLYNYISKMYGKKPNIIYRLLSTMYLYIIPITPDIHVFFLSFYRMAFPLIIYYIIESFYGEVEDAIQTRSKGLRIISASLFVVLIVYMGLISCLFKYGALVIGSGSMTGTIDKGDVIIFDRSIDAIEINKKDIIVFVKDNIKIVHRVIDKKETNGEYRFYTKGDYNKKADDGYITESELYGSVLFKIKKIGLPTIWLHEMFEK